MAGIYLHIPFCKQACYYCNFHFSTSLAQEPAMVTALLKETELQKEYLAGAPINTIYFGGGTPSLLPEKDLLRLLAAIHKNFTVNADAEITLEANPDDLTPEKLHMLQSAGVNRLSIGIQSFHEEDLKWMHRAHNAVQAKASILHAQDAGFENITIDLIYGGPTLTDAGWEHNVQQAVELGVPHLSCYALTVEPGTALDHFIKKKKMPAVDADKAARHFEQLLKWTGEAGYEQYEISNFAKKGWHSKHNSSYWQGAPYLGLGPSAHSFDTKSRQWNVANNALYIKSLEHGQLNFEKEELTPVMMLNEYLMTSLRTSAGCDLNVISDRFGKDKKEKIQKEVVKYLNKGWMYEAGERLILTPEGRLFADGIASQLFF
ncbi:radical SAM family heme chaperone HemW [Chitinophaga sp.]|uniref:radical SAM family heme chaperone HemW n=1 Tax=Chitinophaga sp. TaxID=1869181 RepID=UPI0031E39380